MGNTDKEYTDFVKRQADKYTESLKSVVKAAVDYHGRRCESPYPLNILCTKAFVEHFMENFSEELTRRQKEAVPEMERNAEKLNKTEEDILTHFFGPPFDPRMN